MQKGNVNGATRVLLTNGINNWILPISNKTLQMLGQKVRNVEKHNKLTMKWCYKVQKDEYAVSFVKRFMRI